MTAWPCLASADVYTPNMLKSDERLPLQKADRFPDLEHIDSAYVTDLRVTLCSVIIKYTES